MILRVAKTLGKHRTDIDQVLELFNFFARNVGEEILRNWSISLEFLESGAELIRAFCLWAYDKDRRQTAVKLETCLTWWKPAFKKWLEENADVDNDQIDWRISFNKWLPSYGKPVKYTDAKAPSQALKTKHLAMLQQQRKEDEEAEEKLMFAEEDESASN
jgi:hypothetical protein